jgi:hypothetical protein
MLRFLILQNDGLSTWVGNTVIWRVRLRWYYNEAIIGPYLLSNERKLKLFVLGERAVMLLSACKRLLGLLYVRVAFGNNGLLGDRVSAEVTVGPASTWGLLVKSLRWKACGKSW